MWLLSSLLLLSGGLSSMRYLLYLNIHTRRGNIIWLPSKRVMVTPAVCPRYNNRSWKCSLLCGEKKNEMSPL